jgi:hypothetical protein
MTRGIDRIVLIAGVVIVAVVLIAQIAGAVSTRRELREKHALVTRFAEKANANDLPPPMKNPTLQSGRVLGAWEKLPLSARTLDSADFFPLTYGGMR